MPERYSTMSTYRSYIKNHIRHRWADTPVKAVKLMAVEDWLKKLTLAPKTRTHIRGLCTGFFSVPKGGTDRQKPDEAGSGKRGNEEAQEASGLTPEQFHALLPLIREPYRTMVIAGCLGLRVSEVALQWRDSDFFARTLLIQRSAVHGRIGDVETEYSQDTVLLDSAVVEALIRHKERSVPTRRGWQFASPATGRPSHQDDIQQNHIRRAGLQTDVGGDIGWHTFRHSNHSWLDKTGAPLNVQKELMRHASIQTTMNIYGGP